MVSQRRFILKFMPSKGYAFTIDAVFAVLVFIALLFYSVYFSSSPIKVDSLNNFELKQNFDAALLFLDENNSLQSMNSTIIGNDFNSLVPVRYDWRLKIEEYDYNSVTSSFDEIQELSVGNLSLDLNELAYVKGRRLAVSYADNDINKYYNAEYWGWLK